MNKVNESSHEISAVDNQPHKFHWDKEGFYLDDKPFQILSGEMHYSRIPREYWLHRIQMAKAMGLNTIAIYMFWNAHETQPGVFNFADNEDVAEFVRLVQQEGLWLILRPGPYCCAEWDFGGLPPWLLKDGNLRIRCMYPGYLDAVNRYIRRYAQELVDLQCTNGGPILMVQVENEYGSYGRDKEYLRYIKNLLEDVGFNVPLFTCDGAEEWYFEGGALPEILNTGNFGNNPQKNFANMTKYREDLPHFCTEYYPGWFTHWGDKHSYRHNPIRMKQIQNEIEWMLQNGKSFNFYMVHGGTNFGFSAGANFFKLYNPDITSYDYGAPIQEHGEASELYHKLRDIFKENVAWNVPEIPILPNIISIPTFSWQRSFSLLENLPDPIPSKQIHSMEYFGMNNGLIIYETKITPLKSGKSIRMHEVHDYAHIFLDGVRIGDYDRGNRSLKENLKRFFDKDARISLPKLHTDGKLQILVESHGRVNYGTQIIDRKGITEYVDLEDRFVLMDWLVYLVSFENHFFSHLLTSGSEIKSSPISGSKQMVPKLHYAEIEISNIGDTFLDMRGYRKGMVWVNGHNLGRFWEKGPQYTLYCPGVWLKKGFNQFWLLDMEGTSSAKKLKSFQIQPNQIQGLKTPLL